MSDRKIIYLDNAIDALEKVARLFPYRVPGNRDTYDRYNEAWNDAIGRAEIEIEELPSAQPEKHTDERTETHACDCISRRAAIDAYGDWYVEEGTEEGFIGTVKQLLETLPSVQPEQSVVQERYEDLCEYFGNDHDAIKTVLGDRKEFKAWLERLKWHVKECNKLSRQLEVQPEIIHCKDCVHHIDGFFCRQANHHTSDSDHCASVFRAERREE